MEIFATNATRHNLKYSVLYTENEREKYSTLRELILNNDCPSIVYVSRTKKAEELALKLNDDLIAAGVYHGQMNQNDKIQTQDAFIKNHLQVIVATSAFGMGVDKSDVGLVVHYEISNSLENYVQEAGRAGRDQNIQAKSYILFNEADLDKHFFLLNQTKITKNEIQQVYKAIKYFSKNKDSFSCSALELARQAGWDDNKSSIEGRIKAAVAALENAGYIIRGKNISHVYATGILAKTMAEASEKIEKISSASHIQKQNAKRIIQSLISSRSTMDAIGMTAETRIDYLCDNLSLTKQEIIDSINILKQHNLLADSKDMSVTIQSSKAACMSKFNLFIKLENYIISQFEKSIFDFNFKQINEGAKNSGISKSTTQNIRTILFYMSIKKYIKKQENKVLDKADIHLISNIDKLKEDLKLKKDICRFVIESLYKKIEQPSSTKNITIDFSLIELFNDYKKINSTTLLEDIENSLLYLQKIEALNLEGGFLVLYNKLSIKRIIKDNKINYKAQDYNMLSDFYNQKTQQIHIVGEYANMMTKNYETALQFVKDYFSLDFKKFIQKYFKDERYEQINLNISSKTYKKIFDNLSDVQKQIILDNKSKVIVVTAGAGSGKTDILLRKLFSLMCLEDIKSEQLLMLTFSRAAVTEFKSRLIELMDKAAYSVTIKTFHSYCFDLIGEVGSIEKSDIIKLATEKIKKNEVEIMKMTKTVIVIDEAQDMDLDSFNLLKALMSVNEDIRVIAVGDDDQNIYRFRGSNSKYMHELILSYNARKYEMLKNYRSKKAIVSLSNDLVKNIKNRMKSSPAVSYSDDDGKVEFIKHSSNNMISSLPKVINLNYSSLCVLTNTNYEAMQTFATLKLNKINTKLIQSMGKSRMYDLLEIRYFINIIKNRITDAKISPCLWDFAKEKLKDNYKSSTALENCINMLSDFENTYNDKYLREFEEFARESDYEDFYSQESSTVYVSTIHKSKGRQFDKVYLLLDNYEYKSDDEMRKLFVAVTRAKNELYIHYNNDAFDDLAKKYGKIIDNNVYEDYKQIALCLEHKDVNLGYIKNHKNEEEKTAKKNIIFKLRSGDNLIISDDYLLYDTDNQKIKVAMFSKAFKNKLENLKQKGYYPYKAIIRFIVSWRDKNDNVQYPIILPDIYLKKI